MAKMHVIVVEPEVHKTIRKMAAINQTTMGKLTKQLLKAAITTQVWKLDEGYWRQLEYIQKENDLSSPLETLQFLIDSRYALDRFIPGMFAEGNNDDS